MVLISVGFFTLLERRVLRYIQVRKGPNKLGFLGILQPFSDGMKLFLREFFFPLNCNLVIYFFCPILSLFQSLFIWLIFPLYYNRVDLIYGFLFFLSCSSVGVYGLIICGWSSNRSYSILGCIRSVSQAVSYEVSLSLIILCYFFVVDSYSFVDFYKLQVNFWFVFFSFPLFFCWVSCCMAETNRTPFDFSEGESELVSGFNIEYGSGEFAFLFISEYSRIIFISLISCLLFLGGDFYSFSFFIKLVIFCFFFIWVRSCLPRYRYDKLIYLAWKGFLPLSLNYLLFFFFIKFIYIYHFFLLSQ